MPDNMNLNTGTLRSLHRFGDIFTEAIASVESDAVICTPDRTSPDCIGQHWYGLRVAVECKTTGQRFWLHTGLIFLPETRTGLMVEVDRQNNEIPYDAVWNNIKSEELFEVNKDEPVYLKLFMPDATFAAMQTMDRKDQKETLAAYFKACAEAICGASYSQGFALEYDDLANTLSLARAAREALGEAAGDEYSVEVNDKDPDNFGQYAMGYRYWLQDSKGENRMYAYFGFIYSYKKEPAGLFAEIDWLNNQPMFEKAFKNMQSGELFRFSDFEPKFIKLFLTDEKEAAFNKADLAGQKQMLKQFLHECNTALVKAAR